jgi:5-methylcytosine-specific restriction endonuclease McrBC regulatory subunit McrC
MLFFCFQELIPVILCTAIHHPDTKERDNLMHMLFNLIKRPDEEQRYVILEAFCLLILNTETLIECGKKLKKVRFLFTNSAEKIWNSAGENME